MRLIVCFHVQLPPGTHLIGSLTPTTLLIRLCGAVPTEGPSAHVNKKNFFYWTLKKITFKMLYRHSMDLNTQLQSIGYHNKHSVERTYKV